MLYIAATGGSRRAAAQLHFKTHTQHTHIGTHSFVAFKPMGAPSDISEYCRTSETGLEPLSLYCTSSIPDRPFHVLSILSCSLLNKPLFFCLHPSPLNPLLFPLPFTPSPFIFHSSSTSSLISCPLFRGLCPLCQQDIPLI